MHRCSCGNEIFLISVDRLYIEAKLNSLGAVEVSEFKIRNLSSESKCKECGRNWHSHWDFEVMKWLHKEVMGPSGEMQILVSQEPRRDDS